MQTQPFNVTAFDELIELELAGTEGLIADLIADFLVTSVSLRDAIQSASEVSDLKLLERSAHSLKSSARLLGLDVVADLARAIEDGARHGRIRVDEIHQIPLYLDAGHAALCDFRASREKAA